MSIATNLYPPLIADTQAAFVRTETCKIYFSLSVYNSASNIANVQISLINQKTNQSGLKAATYPSGIKIAELKEDSSIQNNYRYYVEINPNDLESGIFQLNQFYKVQLRFTSMSATVAPSSGENLATWLAENTAYFSEWSTVCLIKGIEEPQIYIHNFLENTSVTLNSSILDIVGKMYFNDSNEKEYLNSYKIQLYNENTLLVDSGDIYTNQFNPNEFNYELGIQVITGLNYTMYFTFTTINGYVETKTYKFSVIEPKIDKLDVNIFATPDNENGRVKLNIISRTLNTFLGNLTIRRTSSESNFHKWEDVKNFVFKSNDSLNITWYDYTVESGVWYKYGVQKKNYNGDRGVITITSMPIMCEFDDIFLVRDDCQLKIQFNPSLSEFKYNVTESQQTTLGGKFPFIRRNGNNYYRSFPIGGLISSFSDTTNWYDPHYYDENFHINENEIKAFTSKNEIYGDYAEQYNKYNIQNNISDYQDRIYERKFREKVYEFLYKHTVKLFKSTTEGNILVKLMNIDFQPIESLGRRLYSFTATAIEIDEPTIKNYDYYGIQTIGSIETKNISYEYEILGQLYGYCTTDEFLSDILKKKYQRRAKANHEITVKKLTWLRIEVYSDPYIIIEDSNGQLIKATNSSTIDLNAVSGYIVVINGVEMILKDTMIRRASDATNTSAARTIDSIGYFELNENDTEITSFKFKYAENVVVDFIAVIEDKEMSSKISSVQCFSTWGQLFESFKPEESIIERIAKKYFINYSTYSQKLSDISHIKIQAPINTVVYIKDSKDDGFNRHILKTGYLEFQDDDVSIEGVYFCGIHLEQHTDVASTIRDNEYYIVPGHYEHLTDVIDPVPNGVYQFDEPVNENAISLNEIANTLNIIPADTLKETDFNYLQLLKRIKDESKNRYIYYHGKWYPFTSDGDVPISIDGIIDYYGEISRTVYSL